MGEGGGGGFPPHHHSPLLIAVDYYPPAPDPPPPGSGTILGCRLPACYATGLRLGSLAHLLLYHPFKSSVYRYFHHYYWFVFFPFGKVSAPPLPSWVFILLRLLRSSPPTCPAKLSSKAELSSLRPSPTEPPVYFHSCHKTCAGFQNLYFLLFLLAQTLAAGWVSAQMGSDPFRRGTRRPQKMPFQRS